MRTGMQGWTFFLVLTLIASLPGMSIAQPVGGPDSWLPPGGGQPVPAGVGGSIINVALHGGEPALGLAMLEDLGLVLVADQMGGEATYYDRNLLPQQTIVSPGAPSTLSGVAYRLPSSELYWVDIATGTLWRTDTQGAVLQSFPFVSPFGGVIGGATWDDVSDSLWFNDIIADLYFETGLDGNPTGLSFPNPRSGPSGAFGNGIAHVSGSDCFDLPVGLLSASQVDELARVERTGVEFLAEPLAFIPDSFLNGNVWDALGSSGGALGPVNYIFGAVTNQIYEIPTFDFCGPPICLPVENLSCAVDIPAGGAQVTLTWTLADSYFQHEIVRDGVVIATLPGFSTGHVDPDAPTGSVAYEVRSTCVNMLQDVASCAVEIPFHIPAGEDCLSVTCLATRYSFCAEPIPAGAFGPGSEAFAGEVRLGEPTTALQLADLVIRRLGSMVLPEVGSMDTTLIEVSELELAGCETIEVEIGGAPVEWSVRVGLSPDPVLLGGLTVTRTHAEGGIFDAIFSLKPAFHFTRRDDPGQTLTFEPSRDLPFVVLGPRDWVTVPDPAVIPTVCADGFAPGVFQDAMTGDQCATGLILDAPGFRLTAVLPGGTPCPGGACWAPGASRCTIVAGPGDCPAGSIYLGDGTSCSDADFDDLPDAVESHDCCVGYAGLLATGTDPRDSDSDGDGIEDLDEICANQDPCRPDPAALVFVRGDVDTSGAVGITDPIALLNLLFVTGAPVPPCLDAGDADDDGALTIVDGLRLLNFLFVLGAPPPAPPFPGCGPDPTPDAVGCEGFPACEPCGP